MAQRITRSNEERSRLPVLAAAVLAVAVLAGPMTALAEEVTVSGCPQPGVEAGCIMLQAADGTLYDVSAAEPKPEAGVAGTVTGTASQGASLCMQGVLLKPATWQPTPGAACPAPKQP